MYRIKTIIEKVEKDNLNKEIILKGADILKRGGTVAFPTETVYGLGVNGLDENAIDKVFIAKGRPQDNPLILHVSSIEEVYPLVESIDERAKKLMKKFWPGPLTLIFEKSDIISNKLTGGLSTVAIRMPKHIVASELIKHSNLPIAAPSANLSGKPSPTNAEHVICDLNGKVDMIIDGGSTGIGVESTVLDISEDIPMILRPGGITYEELLEILPDVEYDKSIIKDNENIIPKSPGQKYKHYSPKAEMIVFSGELENVSSEIKRYSKKMKLRGKKVGIMATEETEKEYSEETVLVVGSRNEKESIAKNLFNILRQFDDLNVDIILAEGVDTHHIGTAIMNRMRKACGGNIRKV